MGLIGIIVKVVAVLVLAVVAIGAYLYFTDYEAEATITDTGQDADGPFIVLRPKILPRSFTYHIDANAAQFVCEGYQVSYRIQTTHYQVFDDAGKLVYDSDAGLSDPLTLVRCGPVGV